MTRRAAILAAIAAIPALPQDNPTVTGVAFILDLQHGDKATGMMTDCKAIDGSDGFVVSCTPVTIPEPAFALRVKYGDRIVNLTAKELMDALEGK
jgi:hypothetical protein